LGLFFEALYVFFKIRNQDMIADFLHAAIRISFQGLLDVFVFIDRHVRLLEVPSGRCSRRAMWKSIVQRLCIKSELTAQL
jgi:hypothetical protein